MRYIRLLVLLALFLSVGAGRALPWQSTTRQRLPIIDMHIHATGWDHFGNPPPPNPLTGNGWQEMQCRCWRTKRENLFPHLW